MAKETVSMAIANWDTTNPIQASVVVSTGDPTKNALIVSWPTGWGIPTLPALDTWSYAISDLDESGTTKYYWFADWAWAWYILAITSTTARYIKWASDYTTNWTNRAGLSYDYYYNIF